MKQKGTMKFSGVDPQSGLVHVKGKTGYYSRRQQEPGLHAEDENIQVNCKAAGSVNGLAGSINHILKLYVSGFLDSQIYFKMTSLFFKAEPPTRLGRLITLSDMDVHPRFTLSEAIEPPNISVSTTEDKVCVKTEIMRHANLVKDLKYYSIHIILVLWNSENDQYSHAEKYTKWLDPNMVLPLRYTFKFDKPSNTTEYMLMCCCLRGERNSDKLFPPERALKIVEVGSFDEKAMAELEEFRIAKKNAVVERPGRERDRDEDLAQEPDGAN